MNALTRIQGVRAQGLVAAFTTPPTNMLNQ